MASATDSHYHKRMNALKDAGYKVIAYGFERNISLTNTNLKDILPLPKVKNGNYLKRIVTVYNAVTNVIAKHGKDVIYYATTFDIAYVCYLKKVKYIYGISDIVHSNFPILMRSIFNILDRRIISKSICTVLTSRGFIPYLKLSKALVNKCILIENKLDCSFKNLKRENASPNFKGKTLSFGFAGNIRYQTTLMFAKVIGKHFPTYSFIFWGNGSIDIIKQINDLSHTYPNISFMGKFSNPSDLPKVYKSIDIMVCNYDTKTINERIAEPNKLYECIFFNTPMIVAAKTHLGDIVKSLDIGTSINNTESDMYNIITSLTKENIIQWKNNEAAINSTDIIEDYSPLLTRLQKFEK